MKYFFRKYLFYMLVPMALCLGLIVRVTADLLIGSDKKTDSFYEAENKDTVACLETISSLSDSLSKEEFAKQWSEIEKSFSSAVESVEEQKYNCVLSNTDYKPCLDKYFIGTSFLYKKKHSDISLLLEDFSKME